MDYRVPVKYGLLQKKQLDEQRFSNTISSDSFARESMSIWTGSSKEAWFDSKMLNRRRTLLRCERENKNNGDDKNTFYTVAVDVARYDVNTAVTVFKNTKKDTMYKKNLVYIEIIHGANFVTSQAPRIKELIDLYKPREVVIDGNGLGSGLMDAMVIPSTDQTTGKQYPPYYAFNDKAYLPPELKNETEEPNPAFKAIIYNLKANGSNNAEIHANAFAQISNGSVSFLASEKIVKDKLLATKKGQRMDHYSRREYLLPYEMTSRLIDEMNNLKLKPSTVQNQVIVEQISRSIPKDRFSSMEYNLWRIKYYEDRDFRRKKKTFDTDKLVFFSSKSKRRR